MIKPQALKLGQTLGLIAPASPATQEKTLEAKAYLESLGFKVKMGKTCHLSHGYLAGTDKERLEDIHTMFQDPEIDGIIAVRGGYGTSRLLKDLDYKLISENPKVFIGYSDMTAIHTAIRQKSGLVTFHGPMAASDLIEDKSDFTIKSLYSAILEGHHKEEMENPQGEAIETIVGGTAKGQITGGNLCLLTNTIGTPYEIETEGKILLIEEVREKPYAIDRMLTQLKLAGKLDSVEGIILGDFKDCQGDQDSLSLEQVFKDHIEPLGKPTIYNFQAGHCQPAITVAMGIEVELNADKKTVKNLEKPTR